MEKKKRRWGDRIDATFIRDVSPMHFLLPYIYPNRTDNEAFISEEIDLTAVEAFLKEKNQGLTTDKYTLMQVICAALVRTITLRPKMNRFIKGHRMYQRNDLSIGFTIKKQFSDEAKEALAFMKFGPETTIDSLHEIIVEEIHNCRSEKLDNTTANMNMFTKVPRWLMRIVMKLIFVLDYYGKVPQSMVKTDPNHATVFLTNLGSIGLNAGYHHLSNWGTCSIFLVIGKKYTAPVFQPDGAYEMHTMLKLGITLDERIADGYYYSKSIQILKHLLQHPEMLNERADKEVTL